jgi:plastocyanin
VHKAPTVTLLGIAAAITVVLLLNMDSEGRPGTAQASHGSVNVAVGDFFFGTTGSSAWNGTGDPGTFEETTIHAGDSVTWTPWMNFHTVTGCDPNTFWVGCTGDAPIGNSGSQGSGFSWGPQTFSTAGEYPYLCLLHPAFMRGKIVVLAAPAPTPTPTPTPIPTPTPTPPPPVGGIADFPDVGGQAPAGARLSERSSFPYAALVGGLVAVVAFAVAGGWYALRRWPR